MGQVDGGALVVELTLQTNILVDYESLSVSGPAPGIAKSVPTVCFSRRKDHTCGPLYSGCCADRRHAQEFAREVRLRVTETMRSGADEVALRTRAESNETEPCADTAFPKSGGGYAVFNYDAATDRFDPMSEPFRLRYGREGEGLHFPSLSEALRLAR
jgi:hypothetical protein